MIRLFIKKGRTQSQHFRSNYETTFPPEDGQNQRNMQQCGKTSAIQLFKYVKMKSLSHLPFQGKTRLLFAICGVPVKVVESKFDKYYFIHTFPGQRPVKKFWFKYFPVLRLQITKDISKNFKPDFQIWLVFLEFLNCLKT